MLLYRSIFFPTADSIILRQVLDPPPKKPYFFVNNCFYEKKVLGFYKNGQLSTINGFYQIVNTTEFLDIWGWWQLLIKWTKKLKTRTYIIIRSNSDIIKNHPYAEHIYNNMHWTSWQNHTHLHRYLIGKNIGLDLKLETQVLGFVYNNRIFNQWI